MKRYIMTSPAMTGHIEFGYDDAGYLVAFAMEAQLSDTQREWLYKYLPRQERDLGQLKAWSQTLRIEPVTKDLGFAAFWDAYRYKVGNKKQAERLWDSLSEADRLACMNSLRNYHAYLGRTGVAQAHATTYLNQRRWENAY